MEGRYEQMLSFTSSGSSLIMDHVTSQLPHVIRLGNQKSLFFYQTRHPERHLSRTPLAQNGHSTSSNLFLPLLTKAVRYETGGVFLLLLLLVGYSLQRYLWISLKKKLSRYEEKPGI